MSESHWTLKLPLLVLGLVLAVPGVLAVAYRRSAVMTIVGLVLIVMALSFIGYSLTIKEWCVVDENSQFSSDFAPTLRGCLRMKGWAEP
jgi:hypothetical protein